MLQILHFRDINFEMIEQNSLNLLFVKQKASFFTNKIFFWKLPLAHEEGLCIKQKVV